MPYGRDMDALLARAEEARLRPDWTGFAEFCQLRGTGVRVAAMKALKRFVDGAVSWDYAARLAFSRWVLEASRQLADPLLLLPQPAWVRLIVPTVREWREHAPNDAQPYLWLGMLRCDDPSLHLKRALKLDPSCELARVTLTQWILADIDYNQHELPAFYIHDPRDDLTALDQAENLAGESADRAWGESVRREVAELRKYAEDWLAAHPQRGDFATQ
jgi:hypothetical protein